MKLNFIGVAAIVFLVGIYGQEEENKTNPGPTPVYRNPRQGPAPYFRDEDQETLNIEGITETALLDNDGNEGKQEEAENLEQDFSLIETSSLLPESQLLTPETLAAVDGGNESSTKDNVALERKNSQSDKDDIGALPRAFPDGIQNSKPGEETTRAILKSNAFATNQDSLVGRLEDNKLNQTSVLSNQLKTPYAGTDLTKIANTKIRVPLNNAGIGTNSKNLLKSASGQTYPNLQSQGRPSFYVNVQSPLHISSAPSCSFPSNYGQEDSRLSTSEFGYPKRIIDQALKDSVAQVVLKLLTDITYKGVSATKVPSYSKALAFNKRYFIDGDFGQGINNFGTLDGNLPFSTLDNLDSNFNKAAIDRSDRAGDLDFEKIARGRSVSKSGTDSVRGDNPKKSSIKNSDRYNPPPNKNQIKDDPNPTEAKAQLFSTIRPAVEASSQPETRFSRVNPSIVSRSKPDVNSYFSPASSVPSDPGRFGVFGLKANSFNIFDREPVGSGSNIDRLFPPKASDSFLDAPPGSTSINADGTAPVISFKGSQRSQNLDSPFSFDRQGLLGSLPASPFQSLKPNSRIQTSPFGSGVRQQAPQQPFLGNRPPIDSNGRAGSPGVGFAGSLFSDSAINKGSLFNGKTQGGFSGSSLKLPTALTRRKRQTKPRGDIQVSATCTPTYKLLRQYKQYGGACFVVMAESQAIYFAECSNSPCSGCKFERGASRCTGDQIPIWVWSYCEGGPNEGKVMPDRVQVTVSCSCKTAQCERGFSGR